MQKILILLITLFLCFSTFAQDEYMDAKAKQSEKIYKGGQAYEVIKFPQKFKGKKPKNVILLISDGMGFTHLNAALVANKGDLYLKNFKYIGLSETQSANRYTTDSSAGGTAISTGVRTNNSALGVDPTNKPLKTILEDAENQGLATGLVATVAITHATPASFIAHQPKRYNYEEIAADFLNTDIDVFIGGGYKHFTKRKDGRNLVKELKEKGYTVEQDINKIKNIKTGKLAGFTAEMHNERVNKRGDILQVATNTAINILDNNRKGFFLMVEGSQIDWGAHANSTIYIVEEMLDFDRAVGEVLKFAAKDKHTLVIVTADHETGGMSIIDGNYKTGMVKGEFSTSSHTGEMVPVMAYGPGAEEFTGFMKNTDIHDKIKKLLLNK